MIKTFNYLFVTCFGIGSFRFAPGTITSLITTIFLYSLFHIINLPSNAILMILLIVFIYSFYAVSEYIKYNENKDPKEVVVDEFIGQSIPIYLYLKTFDQYHPFYKRLKSHQSLSEGQGHHLNDQASPLLI